MKAFLNDKEVQAKYLARIHAHAKADDFIKGKYWEKGRGSAVGCTIHSYNPKAYETELGVPEWLALLEDRVFDGLPLDRAKTWPVEFLEAINIGSNLETIKIPFLIYICEFARGSTENKLSHKYIDGILLELRKGTIDKEALEKARAQSRPISVTDASAYAAVGAIATDSTTGAAAYAAGQIAYAHAYAHAAGTTTCANVRYASHVKTADKLLELIRGCK